MNTSRNIQYGMYFFKLTKDEKANHNNDCLPVLLLQSRT